MLFEISFSILSSPGIQVREQYAYISSNEGGCVVGSKKFIDLIVQYLDICIEALGNIGRNG